MIHTIIFYIEGCGKKLMGRDHGMEAFLQQIFGSQA